MAKSAATKRCEGYLRSVKKGKKGKSSSTTKKKGK